MWSFYSCAVKHLHAIGNMISDNPLVSKDHKYDHCCKISLFLTHSAPWF